MNENEMAETDFLINRYKIVNRVSSTVFINKVK